MKKTLLIVVVAGLLVSSCGTYTGQGAYVGAQFGSILGSAIGGISGGWRGSDIGTIVGMAGGAVVGAAIGSAADQKQAEKVEEYRQQREADRRQRSNGYSYDYGQAEPGYEADDRIDFDAPGPSSVPAPNKAPDAPVVEIRNARVLDADRDGVIRAGEECKVTFEIMNRSSQVLYDVQPMVMDMTGNKHIQISPNLHVESIAPNSGVRYTASILADKKLKDGQAVIRVGVTLGHQEMTSQMKEFVVETRRK